MFLMPKALLRMKSKPGEDIPGEPGDDKRSRKMIDAPLGDRSTWKPEWPALEDLVRARSARRRSRARARASPC